MPTHEPLVWKVYPDRYDEIEPYNGDTWCVYVEKRRQEDGSFKWGVFDNPGSRGFVFTHTGKKIYDTRLQFRWTRHQTFEEALALAYKVVNTNGPMGMTIDEMEKHWERQRREREAAK